MRQRKSSFHRLRPPGRIVHSGPREPAWDERNQQPYWMAHIGAPPEPVAELRQQQCGVLTVDSATRWLGQGGVRWRLDSGRWQRPCYGVVVTHSGPLSSDELLWVAVLGAGKGAALAGLTAAQLDGLTGFDDSRIHIVIPASRVVRAELPGGVVVHRSRSFTPSDIHPARRPPRTRMVRSLVDGASWMRTENGSRALLAAGVQQRLVRAADLAAELARRQGLHRQALIRATVVDIANGAQALSELDFSRLARRYGLPEPSRQVLRRDAAGRVRWLDACWERARVVAEIDGLWHMEPAAWWADMRRDNDLTISGYLVLRFPAFAMRDHPDVAAAQISDALRSHGETW